MSYNDTLVGIVLDIMSLLPDDIPNVYHQRSVTPLRNSHSWPQIVLQCPPSYLRRPTLVVFGRILQGPSRGDTISHASSTLNHCWSSWQIWAASLAPSPRQTWSSGIWYGLACRSIRRLAHPHAWVVLLRPSSLPASRLTHALRRACVARTLSYERTNPHDTP